jgi:protein O-GlcNAc transferase
VYAYAQVRHPDPMTWQIQEHVDHWRSTVALNDAQVAGLVREDQIDILVDLKLHTDNNRLLVFAHKPAPVQVTWLGYPGTTGMDTIDYRLTDPYLDPPGCRRIRLFRAIDPTPRYVLVLRSARRRTRSQRLPCLQ